MSRSRLVAGFVAGLIGGLVSGLLTAPPDGLLLHVLIFGLSGIPFGLALGPRIWTAGTGLMWGQAYGLLWWMLGSLSLIPMVGGRGLLWSVPEIQDQFGMLLGQVIGYGAVMGLTMYFLGRWLPTVRGGPRSESAYLTPPEIVPPLVRALVVSGLAGLLGAWVFLRGIESADFFPLVASILGMQEKMAGVALHYFFGLVIATLYGLLFHADIRGSGSAIVWGLSYGVLWWMIGPMTLLPALTGTPFTWTIEVARVNFPPLVAHLLYGATVGWSYALVNRLWNILFVDSDPLLRTREGAGTRSLRNLLMGQAGGVLGGLLFTLVMASIGALPVVASLVGSESPFVGMLVHLAISIFVGSTFGLLFPRDAANYGMAMSWGLLYGLLWWLLGPLTLFPALLGQPVEWSLTAAATNYAPLIGHLFYGLGLGLLFHYLARRYDPETTSSDPGTDHPAAALWASTLLLMMMLPLLLSA